MLKHSIFSNSYLNHRLNRNDNQHTEIHGSLAISNKNTPNSRMIICRENSRIWWEAGWKNRR
ncbi:MAG: hypothetical protein Kow0029_02010 [Candidatus Rifleibacteriota bacterium]